ncbi:MAG: M18 family aminopeptidase [Ruminococcaceae bacterium]|nr:M18 family aminopeptidase [Oscillospiraceae bacterium]
MNEKLLKFIEISPTAYHAVENVKSELKENGFYELCEGKTWDIEKGKCYFVSRNNSSLIAFKVPESDFSGFMIAASHSDSPAFKIKENPDVKDKFYARLSVEKYGGMIDSTWLDRPLSVAGRVLLKNGQGVSTKLVDFKNPMALIPNVAIHLNRKANEGVSLNAAVDLLPVLNTAKEDSMDFLSRVADELDVNKEDILSTDLYLYNCEKGYEWGDFVSSPRLDDLQCVFASLKAFENAETSESMPVIAIFDNEEVGSSTKQGADSTFMSFVLKKLSFALGLDEAHFADKVANSMMLSCDNAHGVHPNHSEMTDSNHQCILNDGVVIKYNANQSYCTDGMSAAILKRICEKSSVPSQAYTNRADIRGGSTLGNIANTQLSMLSADIGLAQFAMHSSFETAGSKDTEYMVRLLESFFSSSICLKADGEYEIL